MKPPGPIQERPQPVTLGQAFWYWLKLGFISFGGPAGQIAIMHQDLVEKKRWISERRYLHALNYCMVLPGPEAQQLATYIGWLMHRSLGGIMAGGLFVLPSLLVLIGLSWIYLAFGHVPAVAGVLYGIKPAVTAIVLFAAYRIGTRALKNGLLWAMAALSFLAIFTLDAPFPLIVLVAAILGGIGGELAPQKFAVGGGHGAARIRYGAALIDDDTPTPEHARFRWVRLAKVIVVGLLLWGGVLGGLAWRYGWDGALTQMGWFFTKAALLTFGGAYAVLPYVYQGAVEHFHWLTPPQMIDGLALGETTPGPLIMVVTFVGFVAGWTQELFGPDRLFAAGAIAAATVTYFTFLPSFVFILAGGPLVESTHGNLKFTAPLTGITAAVVGVILNLALFFAYHVFWPDGFSGRLDGFSVAIALAALTALFRFKIGVIPVILESGVFGMAKAFMDVSLVLNVLTTFAAFWHVLAFAAGGVYVFHAYFSLFRGGYDSGWTRIIRAADGQLWLSGLAIIGLGIALSGFDRYMDNPKLWTKALLITVWFISTLTMRYYAVAKLVAGFRTPMLLAAAVNVSCWIYGAFLGVAKPLANGVVPFTALMGGWFATILVCLAVTQRMEKKCQHITASCRASGPGQG